MELKKVKTINIPYIKGYATKIVFEVLNWNTILVGSKVESTKIINRNRAKVVIVKYSSPAKNYYSRPDFFERNGLLWSFVFLIRIKSLAPCSIPIVKSKQNAIISFSVKKLSHKQKSLLLLRNVYFNMFKYILIKIRKKS
jgi:hypothetical protein